MEDQPVPSSGFALNKKTILSIVGVVVLLAATGLGVYLAQQKQLFKPKAFETKPVSAPETSFSLNAASSVNVGDEVRVSVFVRSDVDSANLFAAKLRFPTELLEVKSLVLGAVKAEECRPRPSCLDSNPRCMIAEPEGGWCPESVKEITCGGIANLPCPMDYVCQVTEKYPDAPGVCIKEVSKEKGETKNKIDDTDSVVTVKGGGVLPPPGFFFIKNWVEKTFDNNAGTISLVGGVPNPGHQTNLKGESSLMAEIVFKTKTNGIANIVFDPDSAIYRNSDNENILTTRRTVSFKIQASEPIITPVPISVAPTKIPVPDIGLKVSSNSVAVNVAPGSTVKAFDLISTGATQFSMYGYPTSYGPGINWNVSSGGTVPGRIEPISIQVNKDIKPGIYKGTAVIKGSGSGQITLPVQVIVAQSGDINSDGKITLVDMSSLLSKWGMAGADAGGADINSDGLVNSVDYSMMINILVKAGVIKGISDLPSSLQVPSR